MLILVSLLITSCSGPVAGGEKPLDTLAAAKIVQSGTQGIELKFMQGFPPPYIYDQNELTALIEVQNKGAHNILPNECFIQASGFDTSIIPGGLDFPRSCAENLPELEGKNLYNVKGSLNQIEFTSSGISLPDIPEYSPNIKFSACYQYHTRSTPSVCIDPLRYQVSSQQKACNYQRNIATGGGQGGPVGVGYVVSEMIGNRAHFEISIRNMGTGEVLSPYADIRSCSSSFDRTQKNKVAYTVKLGHGSFGNCKPQGGIVTLYNGQETKIFCDFNIPGTVAYETPLTIDLDYGYMQSYNNQVRIIKTPE